MSRSQREDHRFESDMGQLERKIMLKSEGRINPFNDIDEQMGNTFMMLHKAFKLMNDDLWLQSPHWQQSPSEEMLRQEEIFEQKSKDAAVEIERLAGEIYKSLTGKQI